VAEFSQFDAVLNLLILVIAITFITRRLRFPYTIALILAGLVAATLPRLVLPDLSPEVFVIILLPPILFEAALTLDVTGLRRDIDVVFSYAIVGTLLTLGAVGAFAYFLLGYSLIEAILLGIILSPTDPVAVISAFRSVTVKKGFKLIVEGEALFNDGVAIIAYSLILVVINQGSITLPEFGRAALLSILGGVGLGVAGGYLIHFLIERSNDKFAEVLLGFLLSFGIYRLAEYLGGSGVIAVVMAGLILNYRMHKYGGFIVDSFNEYVSFWEFVAFVASSLAFIFIGLYLDPTLLIRYGVPVLALTSFILVTRYLKAFGLAALIERYRGKAISRDWLMGFWWSGLRGAISVVLVLSASSLPLEHIAEMKAITYGLVLATNVIWGVTIPYAIKKYHLAEDPETGPA